MDTGTGGCLVTSHNDPKYNLTDAEAAGPGCQSSCTQDVGRPISDMVCAEGRISNKCCGVNKLCSERGTTMKKEVFDGRQQEVAIAV